MILADSIGFAATHTISSILAEIPDADVSHGSKNFQEKVPLGVNDTALPDFLDEMRHRKGHGARPYAIHAVYEPGQGKAICKMKGVKHMIIVREPIKQIQSCYAWIVKKVLAGDVRAQEKLVMFDREVLQGQPSVANSFPNALFTFATNHVMAYSTAAIQAGCEIVQMERLVSDEAYFRDAFAVPEAAVLSHFAGENVHRASHKGKVSALGVAQPDEDAILKLFNWDLGDRTLDFQGVREALGYV
ncbi:hypothetical protein [Salipiger sp. PrR003]|uniref:hypothetical protein n=1 Tax=Salipiger sp. PrR003 TaxID=2706776 RepID=UPI0013DA62FB|nr:hypothetical protein [Salipiger sp. PrR003]NDV52886.1 hypothetical protein [Salipiger sp. PrR003]